MSIDDTRKKRDVIARRCGQLLNSRNGADWTEKDQREFDRGLAELERLDLELTGISQAAVDRITENVMALLQRGERPHDPDLELLNAADAIVERDGRSTCVEALRDLADELEADVDYDTDTGPDRAVIDSLLKRRG